MDKAGVATAFLSGPAAWFLSPDAKREAVRQARIVNEYD
jgi:hypothetical protein